jgi:hypothetical protein
MKWFSKKTLKPEKEENNKLKNFQSKTKSLSKEQILFLESVDVNLVLPFNNLFISSYVGASFENLKTLEITHVVTVLDNASPNFGESINSHLVDIIDVPKENILIHFQDAFKFIKSGIEDGRVLIHCRLKLFLIFRRWTIKKCLLFSWFHHVLL